MNKQKTRDTGTHTNITTKTGTKIRTTTTVLSEKQYPTFHSTEVHEHRDSVIETGTTTIPITPTETQNPPKPQETRYHLQQSVRPPKQP